jgi:hypothetical protein
MKGREAGRRIFIIFPFERSEFKHIWHSSNSEIVDWNNHIVTCPGLAWLITMGSGLDGFTGTTITITINYYSLQSILTAKASLHSATRSMTECKRPSLSLINLLHGPRTENTLRIRYPSNSSIVIAMCLRCRCIETAVLLLLPAYSSPRKCV